MKIFYSAGNLNDSNIRLSHFLHHIKHHVKIAAYYNNSNCLNSIHWVLDSLHYGDLDPEGIEKYTGTPIKLNITAFEMMLDDLSEYNPDLIITDYEPISAIIAKCLDIPFISCSPLHLLDGVYWDSKNRTKFLNQSAELKVFDSAIEKLIYSPFGMLENAPLLKESFDWIMPYSYDSFRCGTETLSKRISERKSFCIGTSGSLTKKILKQEQVCVANDPEDIEGSLNAVFVDSLGIGMSIGKAEKEPKYASLKIDKFLNTDYSYNLINTYSYLHERIS